MNDAAGGVLAVILLWIVSRIPLPASSGFDARNRRAPLVIWRQRWHDPTQRADVLAVARAVEQEPSLIGASSHFMATAPSNLTTLAGVLTNDVKSRWEERATRPDVGPPPCGVLGIPHGGFSDGWRRRTELS
jgi:hypothetical protein